LGFKATPFITSLLAVGELITDKLPKTLSRPVPRVSMGALTGAEIGASSGQLLVGVLSGITGSILGALVSSKARAAAARLLGLNLLAALLEDSVKKIAKFSMIRFSRTKRLWRRSAHGPKSLRTNIDVYPKSIRAVV
jgi:uncharacterized membrane protein